MSDKNTKNVILSTCTYTRSKGSPFHSYPPHYVPLLV